MKFSFIVPVYKKPPETLRRSLKSLFDMSHKDIEVICVFDGADADLEAVAKEFPEVKSVVIEHGGAPKARNEGAKHMSKEGFVSFWDADCYAEPEMASMWEVTLKDHLDCDFCYSGYAWNDPRMKPFESEPFNPEMLEHYNYIASMFPLAKDKFPGWDESLTGLQDWDYWRRVVKNGSKGVWIEGHGFVTEPPSDGSISFAVEKTAERIGAVRKKLGDPERDVVVHGLQYKREAAFLSKVVGADFIWNPFWLVKPYKLSLMVGFHPSNLNVIRKTLDRTDKATKRGIYWMGLDAESFYTAPYWQVKTVIRDFEKDISFHLCEGERTQEILKDMGLKADIVPFPYDAEKHGIDLPEKFKVIVLCDEAHEKAIGSVMKAMPDVDFTRVVPDTAYNMMDYTLSLQYLRNPRLDNNSRNFIIKGRYLITNTEAPHVKCVPLGDDVTKFKNSLIDEIRAIKTKSIPNMEARNYYLDLASPEKFKQAVLAYLDKPKLEVVS